MSGHFTAIVEAHESMVLIYLARPLPVIRDRETESKERLRMYLHQLRE